MTPEDNQINLGEELESVFICNRLDTEDLVNLANNLKTCKLLSFRGRSLLIYRDDLTFPYKTLASWEIENYLLSELGVKDQLLIFNLLFADRQRVKLSVDCDLKHKIIHISIVAKAVFSKKDERLNAEKKLAEFISFIFKLVKGFAISFFYIGEEVVVEDFIEHPETLGFKKFNGKLPSGKTLSDIVRQF